MKKNKLFINEQAVSMVEYMVLAAAIALVVIYAMTSLSRSAKDSFCLAGSRLNEDVQFENCVELESKPELEPVTPCTEDCTPVDGGECATPSACTYNQNIRCIMTKDCIEDCSACPSEENTAPHTEDTNPSASPPPPPDCYVGYTRTTCFGHYSVFCNKFPSYQKESNSWTCSDDCSNCPPDPSAPVVETYP